MYDSATATAAPSLVSLRGRTYLLSPLTDEDCGILERWMKDRVHEMAERAIGRTRDAKLRRAILRRAKRDADALHIAHPKGLPVLLADAGGAALFAWCMLRRWQPTLTVDDVRDLIANPDEFGALMLKSNVINAQVGQGKPGDGKKPVDRAGIYRYFASMFGWTPEIVGRLTPNQIALCVGTAGTINFKTFAEAKAYRDSLKAGKHV